MVYLGHATFFVGKKCRVHEILYARHSNVCTEIAAISCLH